MPDESIHVDLTVTLEIKDLPGLLKCAAEVDDHDIGSHQRQYTPEQAVITIFVHEPERLFKYLQGWYESSDRRVWDGTEEWEDFNPDQDVVDGLREIATETHPNNEAISGLRRIERELREEDPQG